MNNVTVVPKGAAGQCPACGAIQSQIHRNPYKSATIAGHSASPVYTCMACNTQYVEDPRPADAQQVVVLPPAPAEPVRLPGAEAPPAVEAPPTPPSVPVIQPSSPPVVRRREPAPAAEIPEVEHLRSRIARADLERIAGELGLTLDPQAVTVSDEIITEICALRNATSLRATYSAARALCRFINKHGLGMGDLPDAVRKRGERLIRKLGEAAGVKS